MEKRNTRQLLHTHIIARLVADEAGLAVDTLPRLGVDLIRQVLRVIQTGGVNCTQGVTVIYVYILTVIITCRHTVLACDQLLVLEVALVAVQAEVGVWVRLLVH